HCGSVQHRVPHFAALACASNPAGDPITHGRRDRDKGQLFATTTRNRSLCPSPLGGVTFQVALPALPWSARPRLRRTRSFGFMVAYRTCGLPMAPPGGEIIPVAAFVVCLEGVVADGDGAAFEQVAEGATGGISRGVTDQDHYQSPVTWLPWN